MKPCNIAEDPSLVLQIIYENTLSPKYRTEQEGGPVKHN